MAHEGLGWTTMRSASRSWTDAMEESSRLVRVRVRLRLRVRVRVRVRLRELAPLHLAPGGVHALGPPLDIDRRHAALQPLIRLDHLGDAPLGAVEGIRVLRGPRVDAASGVGLGSGLGLGLGLGLTLTLTLTLPLT